MENHYDFIGGFMALLQTTIDDDVKQRADKVFARCGLTSAMAVRVMVTQVANTGKSPFDGLFTNEQGREFSEDVKIAMLREEAKEYGILPDDSFDATTLPNEVLKILDVSSKEVEV